MIKSRHIDLVRIEQYIIKNSPSSLKEACKNLGLNYRSLRHYGSLNRKKWIEIKKLCEVNSKEKDLERFNLFMKNLDTSSYKKSLENANLNHGHLWAIFRRNPELLAKYRETKPKFKFKNKDVRDEIIIFCLKSLNITPVEIARNLGISKQALDFRLNALIQSGLVEKEKRGIYIIKGGSFEKEKKV